MPHSLFLRNAGIVLSFKLFFSSFLFSQNQISFEKKTLYVPLLDQKNKIEAEVAEIPVKNNSILFIKHNSNNYLKVIFSTQKDTVHTPPVEKYKAEMEIKSGNKSYYKKEYSIFQESNQLFFVLLLPTNYIKTLSTDGITEILIDNQTKISLSKKETKQIKETAAYLSN